MALLVESEFDVLEVIQDGSIFLLNGTSDDLIVNHRFHPESSDSLLRVLDVFNITRFYFELIVF